MSFLARTTTSGLLYGGTLTAGVFGSTVIGYISASFGTAIGSLSPTNITTGQPIAFFYDIGFPGGPKHGELHIGGFGADPGATFITSVTSGPTPTTLLASAATYSYSSGTATWTWPTSSVFGFVNGGVYDTTIR